MCVTKGRSQGVLPAPLLLSTAVSVPSAHTHFTNIVAYPYTHHVSAIVLGLWEQSLTGHAFGLHEIHVASEGGHLLE